MVAVPAETPVTTPPLTEATLILLLVQVPPEGVDAKVVFNPEHTDVVPLIVVGKELTVATTDVEQPVTGSVYVIVELPATPPESKPVVAPIAAVVMLLELQVPPPKSVNVVDWPLHTTGVPKIADGSGLTVIVAVV